MTLDQLHTKGDEADLSASEEWGGWKIISEMLDNRDENGLYPTSKAYRELYDFVVAQKQKAYWAGAQAHREATEIKKYKHRENTEHIEDEIYCCIECYEDEKKNEARQEFLKRSDEFFKNKSL